MQRCASPSDSLTSHEDSLPYAPSDSPGSSVSTRLKDEYDELLKYAVVVPSYDTTNTLSQGLTDLRGSFPQHLPPPQMRLTRTQEQPIQEVSDQEADDEDTVCEEDEADGEPLTDRHYDDRHRDDRHRDNHLRAYGDGQRSKHAFAAPRASSPQMVTFEDTRRKEFVAPPVDMNTSRCSEVSSIVHGDVPQEVYAFSTMVDKDVVRMEGLMTTWLSDLKRNVLAEFEQSKIQMLEHYKHLLHKEKERHAAEMNRVQNETESLKEMLLTYEQSIERKDEVIANLTHAMQRQCDKLDMAKTFCAWKVHHNDKRREAFAMTLAERHYNKVLAQKVWGAWHSIVESKWRQRVERACQSKAQEVCMSLTNDYESRIASLNEALESTRVEVGRLSLERERYEETMKKAFMRGVCALNLEAMNMFHEEDGQEAGNGEPQPGMTNTQDQQPPTGLGGSVLPQTVPQQGMYPEPCVVPSPRVITSTGASSSRSTISHASSRQSLTSVSSRTKAGQKGKMISAKLSARSDGSSIRSGGSSTIPHGLNPPMSSVVVEKHQPVTKATIGQATASQFPASRPAHPLSAAQRRIAGQPRHIPLAVPNVQTIKMVE